MIIETHLAPLYTRIIPIFMFIPVKMDLSYNMHVVFGFIITLFSYSVLVISYSVTIFVFSSGHSCSFDSHLR